MGLKNENGTDYDFSIIQTIEKEFDSKREILELLNKRVDQSLNERRNASVRNVIGGLRRLNAQKTQLMTFLSEKEKQLKQALNRWVDFQKLYKELKNINEWFEQREETLSKYQRIVTQREFEIALEDVKVGSYIRILILPEFPAHALPCFRRWVIQRNSPTFLLIDKGNMERIKFTVAWFLKENFRFLSKRDLVGICFRR